MPFSAGVGAANDPVFWSRVREALDDPRGDLVLARVEFDRLDRVAEFFGEGVAEFVWEELVLRLEALAADPTAVSCPPGGTALLLLRVADRDDEALEAAAWELVERLASAIDVGTGQVSIGCTVGVAAPSVLVDKSVAGLLNAASAASRRAAEAGSRQAAVFQGTHELTGRRGILDRSLFDALGAGQIAPWYQPRVRLTDGAIVSVAAVARWRHPVLGTVSASEFVPEARRSGLIREIDRRVTTQAIEAAATWPGDVGVVLPFSGASLDTPDSASRIAIALADTGLSPDRVTVEWASAGGGRATAARLRHLVALRDMGVRLALGGVGALLVHVDLLADGLFEEFTIDRVLVRGPHGRPHPGVLRGLVDFGAAYGLTGVAMGIETPEEQRCAVAAGCDVGQGDLLHPAMREDALREVLSASDYQG